VTRRRARRRHRGRAPFTVLGALVVAVVALGMGSAAYAFSNPSAPAAVSARAATVSVTLTPTPGITSTYRYSGATAATEVGSIAIRNGGSTTFAPTVSVANSTSAIASATTLWLWQGTCSPGSLPGSFGTLAAPPAVTIAAIAPGATATLCIATRVNASNASFAAQSNTITLTFVASATAATSWKATASAQATQSFYQVGSVGTITCAPRAGGGVILSWPVVTNASTYQVHYMANASSFTSVPTPSITITAGAGTTTARVFANDSVSGTTSTTASSYTLTFDLVGGLFGVPQC
jgi:hypothetical protein